MLLSQVYKRTYVNGEFLCGAFSWIVHCVNGNLYDDIIVLCSRDRIVLQHVLIIQMQGVEVCNLGLPKHFIDDMLDTHLEEILPWI